jgi:hypothetical protein
MRKYFTISVIFMLIFSTSILAQSNWTESWDYDDGIIFTNGFPRDEVPLKDSWDIASWTKLDRDIGWGVVDNKVQVIGSQFWHPAAMTLEEHDWTNFEYQASIRVMDIEKPENYYKSRIHLFFKVNKDAGYYYDFNFRGTDPLSEEKICTLYRSIYGDKYTRMFAHAGPDPDGDNQPVWDGNFGDSTYVLKVKCMNDTMQFWVNDEMINWDRVDTTDTDVIFKTGTDIYVGDPADTSIYVASGSVGFRSMKWRIAVDDLEVTDIVSGISYDLLEEIPTSFNLEQNYPNPFNPNTQIRFDLPKASVVKLTIYNVLGQEIKTLINTSQNAGSHTITWNATNNMGQKVESGLYFYTLRAEGVQMTKKMILMQ